MQRRQESMHFRMPGFSQNSHSIKKDPHAWLTAFVNRPRTAVFEDSKASRHSRQVVMHSIALEEIFAESSSLELLSIQSEQSRTHHSSAMVKLHFIKVSVMGLDLC